MSAIGVIADIFPRQNGRFQCHQLNWNNTVSEEHMHTPSVSHMTSTAGVLVGSGVELGSVQQLNAGLVRLSSR
jgi:hypothetical protein